MGTYRYTGAPQFVTVTKDGDYDIVAFGAQGGSGGGFGAEIGGMVHLYAGERLEIIVGGQGVGRGGGGGSFVLGNIGGKYVPIVIAGGGGGFSSGGSGLTTKGNGEGGSSSTVRYSGAGGAGYKSNGQAGPNNPAYTGLHPAAEGGSNRSGGYAGGLSANYTGMGGFGGGGGASSAGGGGGGYSGGNGGDTIVPPGGGGSYDAGIPIASQTIAGANDGNGRVVISPEITCFLTGTRIATMRGDVAVEQLIVGDLARTLSGALRPIRWVGHRTIDCRNLPYAADVQPVRISEQAFDKNLPALDLYLSPGHPVLVGADEDGEGGHLVPIMCLINGTTIDRVTLEEVTYWHVELDEHDILLAEGLPAESYLDWGDRAFFDESLDHALANPDFVVPGLAGRCRPVALDGPVVEAERRRLDAVFATRLTGVCVWPANDADAVAF